MTEANNIIVHSSDCLTSPRNLYSPVKLTTMKPAQVKLLLKAIKAICFTFIVGFFCSFLLALKTKKLAEDLWKQLGITQSMADINIRVSVTGNTLQYAGAKNAKNIVTGNRPAIVNELVAYAKKYTA